MNITCYHSSEAPTHKSWLAYMDLGTCSMSFFADTKLKAVEKAERFFAAEKARQVQIVGSNYVMDSIDPSWANDGSDPGLKTNPWATVSGRGQGFAGKVWMLNRATGNRARVNSGEVDTYQSQGYVVAGPRSK